MVEVVASLLDGRVAGAGVDGTHIGFVVVHEDGGMTAFAVPS